MRYSELLQKLPYKTLMDVRMELIRKESGFELIRLAVQDKKEDFQESIKDYGDIVFVKFQLHIYSLIEVLNDFKDKKKSHVFIQKRIFSHVIYFEESLNDLQFLENRFSIGQQDNLKTFDKPTTVILNHFRSSMHQQSYRIKQKKGLPHFPTLKDAEIFYLFDSFKEYPSDLPFLYFSFIDDRTWIERVIVKNNNLEVFIEGRDAIKSEVKIYAKSPELVEVFKISDNKKVQINLEEKPQEVYLYLCLEDEVMDSRIISKMKSTFFAQHDIFFEDDDSNDFENIIESKGEGLNTEYKKDNANDKNDNILKTICAFANTEGGSIYLGIDDDGNFIGIENTDAESQKILNAFDDRIEGHVIIRTHIHECRLVSGTQGRILEIEVQESDNKPIALRKDHKLSYYKRIGASNRTMRPSDLNYLIQVEARKMSFDRVGLSNQNLL